jgi:8-oxo-dGTP pyrophosphatase MutT (NUDIX family)
MTIAERLYSLANWLDDCLNIEDYDGQAAAESAVVQIREIAAIAAGRGRTYTHPDVLTIGVAEGWAEAETDPARIDWPARQAAAAIPFEVVGGRPVNPCAVTGVRHGRNEMGRWGENLMADALVTVIWAGFRFLLMVERGDGYGWAVPGGSVEPGETGVQAAVRELAEETGLTVSPSLRRAGQPVYVPDPRASDEAWAVTVPVVFDLGRQDRLPVLEAADDARRAEWIPARTYAQLAEVLHRRYGGQVFAAHVGMLKQFLGGAS